MIFLFPRLESRDEEGIIVTTTTGLPHTMMLHRLRRRRKVIRRTFIALGSKVTTAAADFQVGDRVCGAVMCMHSLTPTVGAFAQYVGTGDVVTLKIPLTCPSKLAPRWNASGQGRSLQALSIYIPRALFGHSLVTDLP
ncbi:hypothetical protein ETB97_001548 [Aspergillus alliaceus]|uniref:Uncharacterized protein n=1 Tax=Petromyces alliaceus TaxID=209559 RepID=A0A8H6AG73_PETAA|nr:hypothetical protein ETB97_001548 [Aspergillus burnettii]